MTKKKTHKCKVCKKNIRQKAGRGAPKKTHERCKGKKKKTIRKKKKTIRKKKKKTIRKKKKKVTKKAKKKTRRKKVDISKYKKFNCIWCDKNKPVSQMHNNLGLIKKKLIGVCKRCGPESDATGKLMTSGRSRGGSLTMFGTKIYKRRKRRRV